MNRLPNVITVEDAAKRLLASPEAVKMELQSGRLKGFTIAGEWRTTEENLIAFIEEPVEHESEGTTPLNAQRSAGLAPDTEQLDSALSRIVWQSKDPFDYHWPRKKGEEDKPELYDEAHEAEISMGGQEYRVQIGFTNRRTAGKDRRRAVVFLNDGRRMRPVVEFVGTDDFDQSGKMVSLIKIPNESGSGHTRLQPGDQPSSEYDGMPIVQYSREITGPYAATTLAVLVRKDEYSLMARHAIIRARQKGWV